MPLSSFLPSMENQGPADPGGKKVKLFLKLYMFLFEITFKLILGTFNVHLMNSKNTSVCNPKHLLMTSTLVSTLVTADCELLALAIAYQCCFCRCGPECMCKCPCSCSICHQK